MADPKDFNRTPGNNNSIDGISTADNATLVAQVDNIVRSIMASYAPGADWGDTDPAIKIDHIAESTLDAGVKVDGLGIKDGNLVDSSGNTIVALTEVASAVNNLAARNAATGNAVAFLAQGTDPNISIDLIPKGAGSVNVGGIPITGAPTRQIITAGGTWDRPDGCKKALVQVQSPGGGGGGAGADNRVGGGGGGGAYAEKLIDVTAIASATTTIGAVGTAGAAGNNAGTAGGSTSWADGTNTITCTGGAGGAGSTASGAAAGGVATGGDLNINGQTGSPPGAVSGVPSGVGGDSHLGHGGRGEVNLAGTPGVGYGGGGGGGYRGATTNRAGGDGASAVIIVTEYY